MSDPVPDPVPAPSPARSPAHTAADTDGATPRVALVTGGSAGLGRALGSALSHQGWHVVLDARDANRLRHSVGELDPRTVTAVPGDVADPRHRRELAQALAVHDGLDLLVNNASILGPTPLPPLAELAVEAFEHLLAVNALAPLALTQIMLPSLLRRGGIVVNISSDAAVEAYPGWGGYGASKATLDHLSAVLAVEHPELSVYAVDPGDMNTELHQQAFPGEDVSDRPGPQTVVPALLELIRRRPLSGRYRAADLLRFGGEAA